MVWRHEPRTQRELGVPYLDVLSWGQMQGRRIQLNQDFLLLGRAEACHLRFDDPQLSPSHAAIRRQDGVVIVEDLGSTVGTFVNGVAVTGGREVQPGDVITLADVRLRFGIGAAADDAPAGPPDDPLELFGSGPQQPTEAAPAVGRAQYAEQVVEQREHLLRAVAARERASRRLLWIGAALLVLGSALFTVGALAFAGLTAGALERFGRPAGIFGWDAAGVPSGYLAWVLAALGLVLIVLGVVLHVVARLRKGRIDKEIPAPPSSWQDEPTGV